MEFATDPAHRRLRCSILERVRGLGRQFGDRADQHPRRHCPTGSQWLWPHGIPSRGQGLRDIRQGGTLDDPELKIFNSSGDAIAAETTTAARA